MMCFDIRREIEFCQSLTEKMRRIRRAMMMHSPVETNRETTTTTTTTATTTKTIPRSLVGEWRNLTWNAITATRRDTCVAIARSWRRKRWGWWWWWWWWKCCHILGLFGVRFVCFPDEESAVCRSEEDEQENSLHNTKESYIETDVVVGCGDEYGCCWNGYNTVIRMTIREPTICGSVPLQKQECQR